MVDELNAELRQTLRDYRCVNDQRHTQLHFAGMVGLLPIL
jgi:hypothetical protein